MVGARDAKCMTNVGHKPRRDRGPRTWLQSRINTSHAEKVPGTGLPSQEQKKPLSWQNSWYKHTGIASKANLVAPALAPLSHSQSGSIIYQFVVIHCFYDKNLRIWELDVARRTVEGWWGRQNTNSPEEEALSNFIVRFRFTEPHICPKHLCGVHRADFYDRTARGPFVLRGKFWNARSVLGILNFTHHSILYSPWVVLGFGPDLTQFRTTSRIDENEEHHLIQQNIK